MIAVLGLFRSPPVSREVLRSYRYGLGVSQSTGTRSSFRVFEKLPTALAACRISETVFGCWNFLYLKFALNLMGALQCGHAAIRDAAPSKMPRIRPVIDAPPSCSFAIIRRHKTEKPRASRPSLVRSSGKLIGLSLRLSEIDTRRAGFSERFEAR